MASLWIPLVVWGKLCGCLFALFQSPVLPIFAHISVSNFPLFIVSGLFAKDVSSGDFRDYNPYTADLFRRRPLPQDVSSCQNAAVKAATAAQFDLGDFPSLTSIDSLSTTMYSSLVSSKSASCKSNWARRNLGAVFSGSDSSANPIFEGNQERRA